MTHTFARKPCPSFPSTRIPRSTPGLIEIEIRVCRQQVPCQRRRWHAGRTVSLRPRVARDGGDDVGKHAHARGHRAARARAAAAARLGLPASPFVSRPLTSRVLLLSPVVVQVQLLRARATGAETAAAAASCRS